MNKQSCYVSLIQEATIARKNVVFNSVVIYKATIQNRRCEVSFELSLTVVEENGFGYEVEAVKLMPWFLGCRYLDDIEDVISYENNIISSIQHAKDLKKELETNIQTLLNVYMQSTGLPVDRIGINTEMHFAPPFCSSIEVEVRL